jgi:uridine kinase
MKRILITGMSATGKSAAVAELARRGYAVVNLDAHSSPGADGEWLWDEVAVAHILEDDSRDVLFVSGCADNQHRFYDRFDAIVLLSAPADVMIERLRARTTNDFGKTPEQLAKVLDDTRRFEPLLRWRATHEIVTTAPVEDVVAELVRIVRSS